MAYTPTLWAKGDIVTSEKLNKIEQGIVDKVDKVNGKTLSTNDYTNEDKAKLNGLESQINHLESLVGSPLVASTAAEMTDEDKIYVYTGSETGYQNGNWYYYNGTTWTSGGVYNSVAFETDDTLSIQGKAADAKKTGDELLDLKEGLSEFQNEILVDGNIISLSNATLMHTAGDATISFNGTDGFLYTRVTAANNQLGFTFPTQAQKKYTLKLDVSDIPSGNGVRIYVCPTSVYNAGGALAFEDYVTTDKTVTLEFTAITAESSLWFYVSYKTPSCTVSNVSINDGILRYKSYIMDYDGTEISVFNKIACVGDSITEGTFNYSANGSNANVINIGKYSYPTILKKLTGVETANLGRGGNTSVQWYSYYQNEDLSGYDAVIIMLGINDGVLATPIADFTTAICNIIDKFKAENNGIKVFLATIIPAYTDYDRKFDAYNTELRRIATEEYNDIFLTDINLYSECKFYTYYAQRHLTAIGYQQLAKEFATLISYTIHQNPSAFRNVQFIGTEYTYNR